MQSRKTFLESHLAKAKSQNQFYTKRSQHLSWIRLSLIVFLLLLSYWAMQEEGPDNLLWAWAPGIVIFLILVRVHLKVRAKASYYGAVQHLCDEDLAAIRGENIREPYSYKAAAEHPYARELDLFGSASLHHYIDRSFTAAGAQALADELLSPPYEDWKERQAYFSELEQETDWALDYRAHGFLIEDKPDLKKKVAIWAENPFTAFPKWYWLPMLAGLAAVWFFLLTLIWEPSSLGFQKFILALSFNLILLGSRSKILRAQHAKVGHVSELMSAYTKLVEDLGKRDFNSSYARSFLSNYKLSVGTGLKLKKLSELLSSLDQSANAVALVVLNGLFHYHLFRLRDLEKWHRLEAANLAVWLEGLYRFEAHLSLANYQANHPDFVQPKLQEKPSLQVHAMGHPLISSQQRVNNDLHFTEAKYIILTGSNMSGKSTFLRTVGINLLLAQLGTKVCAEEFKAYPFQLLSSMNPQDDLRSDTSYFKAEILRLRALLDQLSDDRYSFFLLDEILRGTNSNDKQEGTRGFLQQVEHLNAWGIIATHDVDIAHLADNNANFHAAFFESKVDGEQLLFDYQLRDGICKTPNASLLMRRFGLIPGEKAN